MTPKNNSTLSQHHLDASTQQSETQEKNQAKKQAQEPNEFQSNNMPRSRYRPSIAALWESDSEIITKLHDSSSGSHIQKSQDIIHQQNGLQVEPVPKSNVSSDKRTESFDDDETDLFER